MLKVRRTNVSVWMHVCEWVNGLLGCIGILKCDWQGRSLLGEIINRVEPVISPRQPWKETADSQGSYWEFQRCRLTDLGPGPHHTEPASQVVPESALINVPSHPPSFILPGCAAFSEKKFLFSMISSSILSLLLFLLCQLCIFLTLWYKLSSLPCCIFRHAKKFAYTEHNLIHTIKHIETTNQTKPLQRRAQKQTKLVDLLTLYFPSLF